ncbi:phosphoinositide-interacting protein-like [Eucyclogobius newberryi]|uniref:phosphoinositide-interacting protein-like n=1 Tax=Eucyclogobius newberryi TaxID=166745 RepID=UPI003B5B6D50
MEDIGNSFEDGRQSLVLDDDYSRDSLGCAYLHKPVIAMVMGSLMSAAGVLLLLLHTSQVGSACLSIGLMFVMVGLVWIPVLKEKHRRKRCALGE